ncbi:MAG TPA: bifunctional phosphoserine phosphatase/homoserine phosphotransferase ThrH [Treponemataceae bacterium]|nr:bifunctional phosphoserine phosphatase/homoserine phosphotransferase ThrH [Treponemataceae bacterium]
MHVVCLDLEGVLVPEIWIEFSKATGIEELRITTRDEPDYDKLMKFRIEVLERNGLKLADIQRVIGGMDPLPGAKAFMDAARAKTQVIILSDTFTQFALPLMAKLGYPTLFCNELAIADDGAVTGYTLRQSDGKRKAVAALKSINMKVMASGDSYNDLGMITTADSGALFRAPDGIKAQYPSVPAYESYDDLLAHIDRFIRT